MTANKLTRSPSHWWLVACGLTLFVAAIVLFMFNPVETRLYPTCWFYRSTGLLCPGCGSLRALHQLVHAHFLAAFRLNPLLMISLPFLIALTWRRWRERHLPPRICSTTSVWVVWLGFAVVLGFGVLRNLPAFDWLRPL